MTREEAIRIIGKEIQIDVRVCTQADVNRYIEALKMAIAALKQQPPCKIGDEVFGIKRRGYRPIILQRKVTQLFYSDDMELCAVVENVCRGKFGEVVFLAREEAEEALRRMEEA